MGLEETYPRRLSELERALLLWVLPEDRPGYAQYRRFVSQWMVVGKGRREEGNYILGSPDLTPDVESPLPQLFAFGCVKLGKEELTISVRERLGDQLEYEISGPPQAYLSLGIESYRRWTLSEWMPNRPCPNCGAALREVQMKTVSGHALVLAVCAEDHRLWVFDAQTGVNHPIPVTSFYNELMLQNRVQDRRTVPDSKRLFTDIDTHSDAALTGAFSSYNRLRTKVLLGEPLVVQSEAGFNWFRRATRRLFRQGKTGM